MTFTFDTTIEHCKSQDIVHISTLEQYLLGKQYLVGKSEIMFIISHYPVSENKSMFSPSSQRSYPSKAYGAVLE